jgi:hypothetical protein
MELEDYRHRVEVHLALSAVNSLEPSLTRFAIRKDIASLPFKILNKGERTLIVAKRLFQELTGTDPDPWFIIKQVGVTNQGDNEVIVILYVLLIPETVPLFDESVQWVDFEALSKYPHLLNTFGRACNHYRGE